MSESKHAAAATGSTKACAACGAAFTCCAPDTCWCGDVDIRRETLKQLAADYADCLCPACLQRAARTGRPLSGEHS